MLKALDLSIKDQAIRTFEKNLQWQENNITERGESSLTKELRIKFELFKKVKKDDQLSMDIRKNILSIIALNMNAIKRKNEIAKTTANDAFLWITITGGLCFLMAFTVFFSIPSDIANSMKEFSDSIKEISNKNYSKRISIATNNEFGELAHSFNTMAEKLEEYNNSNIAKLLLEKKRIETLVKNMSDPVIGLDENKNVVFINEQALQILSLNEAECIDHFIDEISLKNDLIRHLAENIDSSNSVADTKAQPVKIFANNKESYFQKEISHISFSSTNSLKKQIVGHVIILRNITEYHEINSAKTNFIATISHELKTPISSIKMSLQLLANNRIGILNDEQSQLIHSIEDDTARLLKITRELLNITQIENGNIQLSIMPVNIEELISYALNALKSQAEQKQIVFQVDCPESTPRGLADSEKTTWVLMNLISNAIRYSHENSTIRILAETKGEKVRLSVKDSGLGIAPEYKEKVFNRYFRVPNTNSEGNGLGLSISKEFIEAQGGEISMESEVGMGSTFFFQLNSDITNKRAK